MERARRSETTSFVKTLILFLFISLVIVSPQFFMYKSIILDADSVFHLNRFYDTYMQIKQHNFQPFIMMYGFGGVGRYINVVYGPIFAYICGMFLFIFKSYHTLQLALNFFTVFTGMLTTYHMLKTGKITQRSLLIIGPIFYVTSFAIVAWLVKNEFLGIGAAFLPLAVSVAIRMTTNAENPIKVSEMSITMIVLMQIHVLSSILGLSVIILAFTYAIIMGKNQRMKLLSKTVISGIVTLIATMNIWLVYIWLRSQDKLLNPYSYPNPSGSILEWGKESSGASVTIATTLFLSFFLAVFIYNFGSLSKSAKFLGLTGITYLLLASGLFPWDYVFNVFPTLSVLQFPYRLAPIGILLMLYVGLLELQKNEYSCRQIRVGLTGLAIFSILSTITMFSGALKNWNKPVNPFGAVGYLTYKPKKDYEVQDAFADKNLGKPWSILNKPVPDYLPRTRDSEMLSKFRERQTNDLYKLFKNYEHVYLDSSKFKRKVVNKEIEINWHQKKNGYIEVPIVHYKGTQYKINGKEISNSDIKMGKMGSSVLYVKSGYNSLRVKYKLIN